MSTPAALLHEIDRLEILLADIGAVTARDDAARRRDLVDLRRQLAAQIATVGSIAEAVFADRPDLSAYRERFSRMRSMAALHQASWPAVILGERPEDYRASVAPMREANRVFIDWVRERLR